MICTPRQLSIVKTLCPTLCVAGLLATIITRHELKNYPNLDVELFQLNAKRRVTLTDANVFAVWTLISVVSMILTNYIVQESPPVLTSAYWANWLFIGVLLHQVFVNVAVYQKWTVHFSPEIQMFQLFPAAFLNLHSYCQIHYITRPYEYQSKNMLFRSLSFFFNLIFLIHLGKFLDDHHLISSSEFTTIFQTLLKGILTLIEIAHRLLALYTFSDVIFNPFSIVWFTTYKLISSVLQKVIQKVVTMAAWFRLPVNRFPVNRFHDYKQPIEVVTTEGHISEMVLSHNWTYVDNQLLWQNHESLNFCNTSQSKKCKFVPGIIQNHPNQCKHTVELVVQEMPLRMIAVDGGKELNQLVIAHRDSSHKPPTTTRVTASTVLPPLKVQSKYYVPLHNQATVVW